MYFEEGGVGFQHCNWHFIQQQSSAWLQWLWGTRSLQLIDGRTWLTSLWEQKDSQKLAHLATGISTLFHWKDRNIIANWLSKMSALQISYLERFLFSKILQCLEHYFNICYSSIIIKTEAPNLLLCWSEDKKNIILSR